MKYVSSRRQSPAVFTEFRPHRNAHPPHFDDTHLKLDLIQTLEHLDAGSLLRVLPQHALDHVLQRATILIGQRRDASITNELGELGLCPRLVEGRVPCTELVDQAAERPDVGLVIVCLAIDELR